MCLLRKLDLRKIFIIGTAPEITKFFTSENLYDYGNIQLQLNGKSVLEGSIKRNDHIKPLSHLQPAIQVEKQKVHIDPTILFSRLIAIVEREEDMEPYFDYELSSFPTSLFKDGFMRKGVKSQYGGSCCICFDGYEQGPSIKDHEHQRRAGCRCSVTTSPCM